MNSDVIALLIAKKGINSINLSMFPEEARKEACERAYDILIRQGKGDEALKVLEIINTPRAMRILEEQAKNALDFQDFDRALYLYEKTGNKEMVELIRRNKLLKG